MLNGILNITVISYYCFITNSMEYKKVDCWRDYYYTEIFISTSDEESVGTLTRVTHLVKLTKLIPFFFPF